MNTELERLRAQLADVDGKLLELVADRARLASAIGTTKRDEGLPTRDFGQERAVIERARARAERLDLSPRLAEELMLLLIRSALTVQEKQSLVTARSGSGKRALVIGGAGKMGRWFVRFLSSQGFEVEVADPEPFGGAITQYHSWTEHDLDHDVIAYVLGLSHALNIAFFTALAESGEAAPALANLSSTTFDEQLAVARKVSDDNPSLYFEIQSLNDYGTESLSALLCAVERLRSLVRAGDEQGFAALMEQGREYLGARTR